MKLASGFCIPEPLPVHTGIKGRLVHPLIRFLLRSRVDEKCADLHKPFISYLFLVGVTVQSAESLSAAIPLGTSTKRANSKRANHGRSHLFQDAVLSVSFWLLICSWLTSRCSPRSPAQQRFPWALQLKEQILKEQITDDRVFFKMPFCPCPSGCLFVPG